MVHQQWYKLLAPKQNQDNGGIQPNLKNLKSCDVQDANKGSTLTFSSIQSFVNTMDQPTKQTLICRFSEGFNSKVSLE